MAQYMFYTPSSPSSLSSILTGEVLRGDRIVNTPYQVRMLVPSLTSSGH